MFRIEYKRHESTWVNQFYFKFYEYKIDRFELIFQ